MTNKRVGVKERRKGPIENRTARGGLPRNQKRRLGSGRRHTLRPLK